MRIQLIRHATLLVDYAGKRLLVDPMLSDQGAMAPIDNSPNPRPNPLVPLPMQVAEILRGVDAVFVTHTHRDHWDDAATRLVPKDSLIFGQAADEMKFHEKGFARFQTIYNDFKWDGVTINRTGGQHGTGDIGKAMAPVSGFVLQAASEPTLYIAGDTIWCGEVEQAIGTYDPKAIVVNAGAARFLQGDPITMTAEDVRSVCDAAPRTKVIAVHMEAINHCGLIRSELRQALGERIMIPPDGGTLDM